jgi:hypothetical protein
MPRIIKPAPGTFTAATVTVDSSGRVIAASSGSAGEKSMLPAFGDFGPNTGTYTANSSATQIFVYLRAGGGGGGGCGSNNNPGQTGGFGGFGIFSVPVSAPYSVPYTAGAGGTAGPGNTTNVAGQPGGSGGSTTWNTNTAVTNGGAGGTFNGASPMAASGSAPGAKIDLTAPTSLTATEIYENVPPMIHFGSGFVPNTDTNYIVRTKLPGRPGPGGSTSPSARNGSAGVAGAVFVYENLGV